MLKVKKLKEFRKKNNKNYNSLIIKKKKKEKYHISVLGMGINSPGLVEEISRRRHFSEVDGGDEISSQVQSNKMSRKNYKQFNQGASTSTNISNIITRNTYEKLEESEMSTDDTVFLSQDELSDSNNKKNNNKKTKKNNKKINKTNNLIINENDFPTTNTTGDKSIGESNSDTKSSIIDYYHSSDKGPFILSFEKENISDIKLGKRLNELNFKNIIGINRTSKHRLKVQTKDYFTANKILKNQSLITLDKYKIFIPNSNIITVGVVKNIDVEMDIDEILDNATCEYKILNVERMNRWDKVNQIAIPCSSIKVTFRSNKLPENFKIYFVARRIFHFIPKPTICKKCLVYGHTGKQCNNNKILCRTCSNEVHESDNICEPKCKYCVNNNNHKTSDPKCPEEIKQKTIKKLMITKKITYQEAKTECNSENHFKTPKNSIMVNAPNEKLQNTFAEVIQGNLLKEEIKKKNILLNILKEKFNQILKDKTAKSDTVLMEIGKIFETYLPKIEISQSKETKTLTNEQATNRTA